MCQKMFAKWTFMSIGRRVTQVSKFAFRLRSESILLFKGLKKHSNSEHHDFQSSQANIHPSIVFPLLEASVPECFLATQRPQTPTRRHNDAMSNSKPKSIFFCALAGFSCGAWALVWIFWSVSMYHPFVEYQQQWFYGICSRTASKMINLSSPPARWGLLDFIRAVLLVLGVLG